MTEKPCNKCGLMQLYDEIWGLAICDSNEAQFYGCPDKQLVLEIRPDWKYLPVDERI